MSQVEVDFAEMLINNKEELLSRIGTIKNNQPELFYFYSLLYQDRIIDVFKEFLLEHFPEKLQDVQEVINKEFVLKIISTNAVDNDNIIMVSDNNVVCIRNVGKNETN